jgi:Tol biopolymer transport system component
MRKNNAWKNVLYLLIAWAILVLWLAGCSGPSNFVPLPQAILAPTVAIAPIHLIKASGKIDFDSNRDGNLEIYVMDANGGAQTRLTHDQAFDSYPAWSPDGQKIAFVSNRDGNEEIYVMDANGSAQTRLNNYWMADSYPTWSADGQMIAFTTNRDRNMEIYAMNVDGSSPTNLTDDEADDAFPDWSAGK